MKVVREDLLGFGGAPGFFFAFNKTPDVRFMRVCHQKSGCKRKNQEVQAAAD
jgi:hypothetical protein